MKVLVVGGGAREHTIIWKIAQNEKISKIYCAPGNAGISQLAECLNIEAINIKELVRFAKEKDIDLTIIGPDNPLALGIVDAFNAEKLNVFGPNQKAAQLESSKSFAKGLMKKYNIPTANYEVFDDFIRAKDYLNAEKPPYVIKADGLALGKGVYICHTKEEAISALEEIMVEKRFGASGNRVVIEEFLEGEEVSVLAFCDGDTLVPTVEAKDYKRIFDNNTGPNTGGMGAISPVKGYSKEIATISEQKIFLPTLEALNNERINYKGIIFFGLIMTDSGPKVIEYNARFGDPEASVVIPRMNTDLLEVLGACIRGNLKEINLEWKQNASLCVVLASPGYPQTYEKGIEITGLDLINNKNIMLFHAGTKKENDKIVTNGGRVLGVTGLAENITQAKKLVYKPVNEINFKGKQFRTDIGS